MKTLVTITGLLLISGTWASAEDITLKATGASGGATRVLGSVVDYQDAHIDLVPFSVDDDLVTVAGSSYTIKAGAGSGHGGNYQAVDFDGGGGGASQYTSVIEAGFRGTVNVGDTIKSKTGNMSGPTNDGVQYRLDNNKKTIVIPVIDIDGVSGASDVIVKGFKVFELEGCGGNGINAYVTAKFLRDATATDLGGKTVGQKHVNELNPNA